MATIRDIALHYYNTGQPLPGQSGRYLHTREDVHEWLAENDINSWDNAQMSMEVPEPGSEEALPPQARTSVSEVSGPPEAAYRRAQYAEDEPSLLGLDLPGRTMSELSDATAPITEELGEGVERVGRAIAQPAVEALQGVGAEAAGIAERERPQLEEALRQRGVRSAPSPAHLHRPMYRGRDVAPQRPPEPTEEEVAEEVAFLERFIEEQPPVLPDGNVNQARIIAIEDLAKVRPPETPVGDFLTNVGLGASALHAQSLGGPARPDLVGAAGESIRGFGEGAASIAGSVAGAATGVVGRGAQAAMAGVDRLAPDLPPGGAPGPKLAPSIRALADLEPPTRKLLPGGLSGVAETLGQVGLSEAIESDKDWVHLMSRERMKRLRAAEQIPEMASIPLESKLKSVEEGLGRAYDHMEELVQGRMDRDLIDNMRTDLSDLMAIVPTLTSMLFSIPEDEAQIEGMGPRFSTAFLRNMLAGSDIADSALAGMAYIAAHPVDSFNTMPISTILTLADVVTVLRGGGRLAKNNPHLAKLMDDPKFAASIDKVMRVVDHWVPAIGETIDVAKRASAGYRRAFGDATANANPASHLYGAEMLREALTESRAARLQFEEMGRLMGRDEGSTFWDTKERYHTPFEEFEKTISKSGAIEQPKTIVTPAGEAAQRVRPGELAIGKKGGARIRRGSKKHPELLVKRKKFAGEIEDTRAELVQFLQRRGGTGKTPYSAAEINRAMSEATSFAVPNTILMSKTVRTRALADAKRWVTDSDIHRGEELRAGSPELRLFMKQAKDEIIAMAARTPMKGITGSSNVYNLKFRLGDNVFSVLDDSVMKMGDDAAMQPLRRQIFADSLTSLANRAGATVEQGRRRTATMRALEDYAPRAEKATFNKNEKAWEFGEPPTAEKELLRVERALKTDRSLPAAFRVDPKELANVLEGQLEGGSALFARLAEDPIPMIGGVPYKEVIRDLRRYEKIEAFGDDLNLLQEMGVNHAISAGEVRRVNKQPLSVPGGIWVNPGTKSTLKWWARDLAARRKPGFWPELGRWMKANLTARRPGSHVNNIMANVGVQTIRRGEPLNPARVLAVGKEYKDYLSGKITDPKRREIFRAIDRTGGLRTDMVISELKALEKGIEASSKGVLPHHTLERIYGWEDNVFKLEEALRNYDLIDKKMSMVGDGQYVELEVGRGKLARMTKKGDRWRVQEGAKRGKLGRSYSLSESKVRDIIAKASMKPALDLFFDYSDVSQLAKGIRSIPALAAFAAPFYSWYSKAMTVPFAQKGIMGHMLSSQPFIRTDNPRVLTSQVGDAVAASARRSMVANGMRQELMDNHDMVAQMLGGRGSRRVPALIRPVLDSVNPLYFEFKNLEYQSASQPADTLLRLIYHGIGTVHLPTLADAVFRADLSSDLSEDEQRAMGVARGEVDSGLYTMRGAAAKYLSDEPFPRTDADLDRLEKVNPGKAKSLRVMRNVWRRNLARGTHSGGLDHRDALEFLGGGGSLLLDVANSLNKDPTDRNYHKMVNTFTSLAVPGLYSAGIDLSRGLARDWLMREGTVPSYIPDWGEGKFLVPETVGHRPYDKRADLFMRWGIRRMLGVGTKPIMATDENVPIPTMRRKMSGLRKAYDEKRRVLKISMGDELRGTAVGLRDTWDKVEDESKKKAIYRDFVTVVSNLERLCGTTTARNFWDKPEQRVITGGNRWHPGREVIPGLIAKEVDAAYEYIAAPIKPFFEEAREKRAQRKRPVNLSGREYFAEGEED